MYRAEPAEGNRLLQAKRKGEKLKAHRERMKKIKNRRPGTSKTLDNLPPLLMRQTKRLQRERDRASHLTEQQNKVLLKRIGLILTAPRKRPEEDYEAMRKLVPTLHNVNDYNAQMSAKFNKDFFKRLKDIPPFYNVHDWELDYRRQLRGQRFMRQVLYERPKDYVDPFVDPQSSTQPPSKRGSTSDLFDFDVESHCEENNLSKSTGFVDKMRQEVKDTDGDNVRRSAPALSKPWKVNTTSKEKKKRMKPKAETEQLPMIDKAGSERSLKSGSLGSMSRGSSRKNRTAPVSIRPMSTTISSEDYDDEFEDSYGEEFDDDEDDRSIQSGSVGPKEDKLELVKLHRRMHVQIEIPSTDPLPRDGVKDPEDAVAEEMGLSPRRASAVNQLSPRRSMKDDNDSEAGSTTSKASAANRHFKVTNVEDSLVDEVFGAHPHGRMLFGQRDFSIELDVEVSVSLVNKTDLLISAHSCEGQDYYVESEAEVPLTELDALQGIAGDALHAEKVTEMISPRVGSQTKGYATSKGTLNLPVRTDEEEIKYLEELEKLSRELANSVEIRIEEDVPRLILSIISRKRGRGSMINPKTVPSAYMKIQGDSTTVEVELSALADAQANSPMEPSPLSKNMASTPLRFNDLSAGSPGGKSAANPSLAEDSVVSQQLLDVKSLEIDRLLDVKIVPPITAVTNKIFKEKVERISGKIIIESSQEDKIDIKVQFLADSRTMSNRMKPRVAAKTYPYALSDPEPWPCIVKDFKVGITTGVPSIMHADEKMWEEYYQNLAKSVSINHIQKTNVTTIVLNEVDIQSYNENVMRIS